MVDFKKALKQSQKERELLPKVLKELEQSKFRREDNTALVEAMCCHVWYALGCTITRAERHVMRYLEDNWAERYDDNGNVTYTYTGDSSD